VLATSGVLVLGVLLRGPEAVVAEDLVPNITWTDVVVLWLPVTEVLVFKDVALDDDGATVAADDCDDDLDTGGGRNAGKRTRLSTERLL